MSNISLFSNVAMGIIKEKLNLDDMVNKENISVFHILILMPLFVQNLYNRYSI